MSTHDEQTMIEGLNTLGDKGLMRYRSLVDKVTNKDNYGI